MTTNRLLRLVGIFMMAVPLLITRLPANGDLSKEDLRLFLLGLMVFCAGHIYLKSDS